MANTFNTRISLKYDTYENWETNNPILLSGEVAIVVIPNETNATVQEPTVLLKVGDGIKAFKDLCFVEGVAADVYDWAKESTKPTYNASEISGLENYIASKIEDTNTKYQLVNDVDDPHIIKLQSQEKGVETWNDVVSITTTDTIYDDSDLRNLVGETSVATQIANAISALDIENKADKANSLSGYGITDAYTKTETDSAIANAIGSAGHLKREIVEQLPENESADKETIYMMKDENVISGDAYKEYMLINGEIVQIGDTSVDLSQYAKSSELTEQIQTVKTEAESDATAKANAAETKAKAYADDLNETLSDQISELSNDVDKKANSLDLADIATSGNIYDLKQESGYIVLNCGNATINIGEE